MNDKLKIHWALDPKNPTGNALGYGMHNRMLKEYGEKYFEYVSPEETDIIFHIVSADWFRPIPNKINILLTMWEFNQVPDTYKQAFKYADLIIVPSSYCRDIFRKVTDKPIEVCWEGIMPEKFPFYQRKFPSMGEKFRFMWVGAPNERKGYPLLLEVVKVMENNPEIFKNVELYLKTTMESEVDWGKWLKINLKRFGKAIRGCKDAWREIRLSTKANIYKHKKNKVEHHGKYKNIIFDRERLDWDRLRLLYNSAHCFVLPSFGEGWGLTLCEAMATGAPCVSVDFTGCSDFFDEDVGYPIKYKMTETFLKNYNLKTEVFTPDTKDMLDKMFWVIYNYQEALKKGHRASDRIHNKFTWEKSAARLNEIIRGHYVDKCARC